MAVKRITDLASASTLLGEELIEVSQVSPTITITAATISAAAIDNSYNDSASGFLTAGFIVGDRVRVTGFTGDVANNIALGIITALTAAKMTIGGVDGDVIVDDAEGEVVTISKWTSRKAVISNVGGTLVESVPVSASRNVIASDIGKVLDVTTPAAVTLTIQPYSVVPLPKGTVFNVARLDATNALTIAAASGVTLNGVGAGSVSPTVAYTEISFRQVELDVWMLTGGTA